MSMKIPTMFAQQIPSDVSAKATAIAFLYAIPTLAIVKYLSPLIYGSVANRPAVFQAVFIMSPVMAIGVATLAVKAATLGWKQIILQSIAGCLILSACMIAIIPTAIS